MAFFELKQVAKNQGNTTIFPQINLEINKGERLALQCQRHISNSLIDLILGRSPVSKGEILLDGMPLNKNYKNLSHRVGLLLLEDGIYERLTAEEYLKFSSSLYDYRVNINSLLQDLALADKGKIRISKLTFSEKRRLQLARAILHKPDLLILEEPDQNIDLESKILMRRLLDEYQGDHQAILILSSNFESAVSMTDTVYRLNHYGLKKIEVIDREKAEAENQEETVSEKEELEQEMVSATLTIEKIPAKLDDKIILFDPTEIIYIESNDGVSYLHVNRESFPCSMTLTQLFERLEPFGFFRCHRSYIVNLQRVREVVTWTRNSYSLVLDDSEQSTIPLSKGRLSEFKSILNI